MIQSKQNFTTIIETDEVDNIFNQTIYNNTCHNSIYCPDCGTKLFPDSGCMCCKVCGFSACAIA